MSLEQDDLIHRGDHFVGATIERGEASFGAQNYSFFDVGDDSASGLEGALEEGLEAPPQEEGLLGSLVDDMERDVIVLPDEEDLSLTAMFRTQLRASEGTITDDDIARALPRDILEDGNMLPLSMQPVPHGLTPIAPPLGLASSPLASSSAALGSFNTTLNTSPLLRGMDKPQLEPQSAHAGAPLTVAQLEAQMMLVSDQAAQPPALPLQNTSQHALWGLPGMPPPVPAPPAGMHPPLVQPHPMMYAPPSHLNQMYPPHHMLPADMSPHMRPPMHTVPPRPGMPGFPGHMHMMRPGGGSTPHFPHGVPPGPHMMGPGAMGMHGRGPMPTGMRGPPPGMRPPMGPPFAGGGGGAGLGFMAGGYNGAGRGRPHPGMMHGEGGHGPGMGHPHPYPHHPMGPPHQQHQQHPHQQHPHQQLHGSQQAGVQWRPRYEGKMMSGDEVDHIMHIMYAAVHSGVPYVEDYYYQAFINRHAVARNSATFQPEALRDLTADVARLDPSTSVKYANVDGLGKIVLSNIRTPKVLMDLTNTSSSAGAAGASEGGAKPLDQEPLLAARIMVEDCMHLLLDVDDIDRCFASAVARNSVPQDPDGLRKRRALLAVGIAASFRLPDSPRGAPASTSTDDAATPALDDGVFLRIMALPKGRTLLARALRTLLAQPPGDTNWAAAAAANHPVSAVEIQGTLGPQCMLWAMLRNVHRLFSPLGLQAADAAGEKLLLAATHRLAAAARDAFGKLTTPKQVADALTALMTGVERHQLQPGAGPMDVLLPLCNTRGGVDAEVSMGTPRDWLGEVLACLLQRGEQVGAGSSNEAARWQACVEGLVAAHMRHLEALQPVHAAAQTANNADALALVRGLACRPLAQALTPHVSHISEAQRARMHDLTLRFLS